MVARLCVMVGNAEMEHCFSCQNRRDVPVDGGLCVMVGNAEMEHCFSCQNHRDVPVDGGPSVCDGGERRDGTLLQLPEPQRCTG